MNTNYENVKEEIKNEIILEMKHHIDANTLSILKDVLNKALSNIEATKIKVLPATTEDINLKII